MMGREARVKTVVECVFVMWCPESSSDRSYESGLASLYATDKLSMFHSHNGGG